MKAYHDLGGEPAGPIDTADHDLALWEKRVDAMLVLLGRRGLMRVDENRRALESLGADVYFASGYAGRRIQSIANNLILKGILTVDEIAAKMADIERRPEQLP